MQNNNRKILWDKLLTKSPIKLEDNSNEILKVLIEKQVLDVFTGLELLDKT